MQATDLTITSVSILDTSSGQNHRCAYANSAQGRMQLEQDCPPDVVAQVMEVWGDTPTVEDYVPEPLPEFTPRLPRRIWPLPS